MTPELASTLSPTMRRALVLRQMARRCETGDWLDAPGVKNSFLTAFEQARLATQ